MSRFADNLAGLPIVDGLVAMELAGPDGQIVVIENQPGSQGSLRIYAHLVDKFGAIGPDAAKVGLTLYGEHTADASAHPGKHPNIDRLFSIVADGRAWSGNCVTQKRDGKA